MGTLVETHKVETGHPRERVERILHQLDQLPTLPAVAARLLQLTTAEDSSAREIIPLLEADASLTAAVLRLVGRADLGVHSKAMTVARAVTLLGFKAVRNVVLSLQIYEALPGAGEQDQRASLRRELWKHSLAVACVAEMLAERSSAIKVSGEEFVCGLLHDVGKLALDARLPKSYARVVDRVERRRECVCDAEREVFGLDHCVAGKRVVSRWGLSPAVRECVWLHHQTPGSLPSTVTCPRLIHLIHLADQLVRQQQVGFSGYAHTGNTAELAAEWGVDKAAVTEVLDQLPQRMDPFCELVGLDEDTSRTLYAHALAKANRELGELNAGLLESNRRLAARSSCLTVWQRLREGLTENDRMGDVCAAAAHSLSALMKKGFVLAFVAKPESRCFHVVVASPHRAEEVPKEQLLELDPSLHQGILQALAEMSPGQGCVAADERFETIWRQAAGQSPQTPLWVLSFADSHAVAGGILLTAPEEDVMAIKALGREWEAPAAAIALAVSSVHTRIEVEQTNEELFDLNRRFQETQRDVARTRSVSMVAQMAGGAAHELNNPLSVISGRAQMHLIDCKDDPLRQTLEIIVEQAHEASRIVADLMRFAKPEPPQYRVQTLGEVIESLCQHWHGAWALSPGWLTASVAELDTTVYADAGQLREILDALMTNAVEACDPQTGRVQVNSPSRESDETVRIVVVDNGVGMTMDVLEHAVDPFFSSRSAGRGRGLGLSRAFRLAEINGGRLWVESAPGKGTTVTVELPAHAPLTPCD